MKPFKKVPLTIESWRVILRDLQDVLSQVFDSLTKVVTNDVIVEADLISGSDVVVYHGLKLAPQTVEVVGQNASASVWESTSQNLNRSKYLLMRASATVHVKLRLT